MQPLKLLSSSTSWSNLNKKLEEFTKSNQSKLAGDIFEEEEVVVPAVIEEKVVKKADQKVKDPFIFKTEPYRRDCSRLVYWCNPFESINKGKLGSTQNWRIEKPIRSYY